MTSWAVHHSTTRELEAITGALESEIRAAWTEMRDDRQSAYGSIRDTHGWHVEQTLRTLLRIRKAARMARRTA